MSKHQTVAAMTVNERLAHFGLFGRFDAAVKSRDKTAVVEVLIQLELSREDAEQIASTVLRTPEKYGY